jgi:hypothetical protein
MGPVEGSPNGAHSIEIRCDVTRLTGDGERQIEEQKALVELVRKAAM